MDFSNVPPAYHDLGAVFSKVLAKCLPPHHPYDYAIDLLQGHNPLTATSTLHLVLSRRLWLSGESSGWHHPSLFISCRGIILHCGQTGWSFAALHRLQGLNNITAWNTYPLPLLQTAFDLLKGAQIFTKLYLWSAYHLVCIWEGDEWKTAFNTPSGHFECLVMPFRLTNAPDVFQSLINDVLKDMIYRFVSVYLDDILIFSPD